MEALQSCDIQVDTAVDKEEWEAQVRDVCRFLVEGWSDLSDGDFSISEISGGITNLLLKVCEKRRNAAVTVRVFGPNTDAVIDRKRELQALSTLSACDFGAQLIGVFENGMVQSFLDARTLDPVDLSKPNIAALIAKEVRRLHETDVPGSKEPQLWEDIFRFYEKARVVSFDDEAKQETLNEVSFPALLGEIKSLKEISDKLDAPVVFSHNDLLSGNFMLDETHNRVHLIDFEYGCYSYRGYDIGNHFNEYAGLDCDFSLFPSKDVQYHFFRHYLHPANPLKASEAELEALYVESSFYALVSHMYWAFWAIVQAKFSPINFDYLEYHFLRFNEYKRRKQEFIGFVSSMAH